MCFPVCADLQHRSPEQWWQLNATAATQLTTYASRIHRPFLPTYDAATHHWLHRCQQCSVLELAQKRQPAVSSLKATTTFFQRIDRQLCRPESNLPSLQKRRRSPSRRGRKNFYPAGRASCQSRRLCGLWMPSRLQCPLARRDNHNRIRSSLRASHSSQSIQARGNAAQAPVLCKGPNCSGRRACRQSVRECVHYRSTSLEGPTGSDL